MRLRELLKVTQHTESQTDNHNEHTVSSDKMVQTDVENIIAKNDQPNTQRSFDECLTIYKTQVIFCLLKNTKNKYTSTIHNDGFKGKGPVRKNY